jgi:hypothetical protein
MVPLPGNWLSVNGSMRPGALSARLSRRGEAFLRLQPRFLGCPALVVARPVIRSGKPLRRIPLARSTSVDQGAGLGSLDRSSTRP